MKEPQVLKDYGSFEILFGGEMPTIQKHLYQTLSENKFLSCLIHYTYFMLLIIAASITLTFKEIGPLKRSASMTKT